MSAAMTHLCDCANGASLFAGIRQLEKRSVQVWVEAVTKGHKLLDAMLLQGLHTCFNSGQQQS
jgi:hypothetical protein